MALNEDIVKTLGKKYEPSAMIKMRVKEKDIAFKTDKYGNAVLFFIGKLKEDGSISGERYTRTLKYNKDGKIIKDHWDLKSKAT